jgi:hypothetical protein
MSTENVVIETHGLLLSSPGSSQATLRNLLMR